MKKLMALLTALVLALAVGCAALAEDDMMARQESWLAESLTKVDWTTQDRIELDIVPNLDPGTEESFQAQVSASNGAFETVNWVFYCDYDPEIHVLVADREVCVLEEYAEDSEEAKVTPIYDRESKVTFELDEDGKTLVLRNGAETKEDDPYELSIVGFEKIEAGEGKGEEVTEELKESVRKAMEGLLGVKYEPLKLLAQKDTMMCVLCEATVVYPGAKPIYALLYFDTAENSSETPGIVLLGDDGSEG